MSAFHQFLRSIDQRRLETTSPADRVNARDGDRIRDMSTVPGEEIVKSICRGSRDVKCILVRFSRNAGSLDQSRCEVERFGRYLRKTQPSYDFHACESKGRIASLGLAKNHGGHVEVKPVAPQLPPFTRHFLICRNAHAAETRASDQIADNAGLHVHTRTVGGHRTRIRS